MRSLLFLLVMVFSLWANVRGPDINHDPGSEVERLWHRTTSDTGMEDDLQKFAK
jgi:hypothetical protein